MVILVLVLCTRTNAARNGAPSAPLMVPEMVAAIAPCPTDPNSSAARLAVRLMVNCFFMVSSKGEMDFARIRSDRIIDFFGGQNGRSSPAPQGRETRSPLTPYRR